MWRCSITAAALLALLVKPARPQSECTPNIFDGSCTNVPDCCANSLLTPHDETALWSFGCKVADSVTGVAEDTIAITTGVGGAHPGEARGFGATQTTLADHAEAAASAAGCAAACAAQRLNRCHLSAASCDSGDKPACEAFQYTAGPVDTSSCELLANAHTSFSAQVGTDYYAWIEESVAEADPSVCGCTDDSSGVEHQCTVGCENDDQTGSAAGCVVDPDGSIFKKAGQGECRGTSPTDNADSYYTAHHVAGQAACLALCSAADCFGVTVMRDPDNSTSFECRVWDQGQRVGAQSGGSDAQCWIPMHAFQVCTIPESPLRNTQACHTEGAGALVCVDTPENGAMDEENCASGTIIPSGFDHPCATCGALYGAVGNPDGATLRQLTCRGTTFQRGNVVCDPQCADGAAVTTECKIWAAEGQCEENEAYMLANCPLSCRAWEREGATCVEPEDPDQVILRCTPCRTENADGESETQLPAALGEITCTEDGVSALDAEECENYRGYALDDGSNGPVARVFIEDQGWRDVPIGKPDLTRDEVYGDTPYDRCEQVRIGPNFGRLGIPVPPHYQWRQDRYKTRCELKKRECSSFHRATRIGCSGNNQHYLALVIDYYIDCADDFRGDDPSTRVPCRSTEDYIWGEKRNGDPTFCNRGAENPFDPALGYRWDVPLCLTTPECIRMGESVLLPTATADDVKVFQLECCTITNPSEVTSPDGSSDLMDLCTLGAQSGASRPAATVWGAWAGLLAVLAVLG